jgi:hypothetical protein
MKIQENVGILKTADRPSRRNLELEEKVRNFYYNDDISQILGGFKNINKYAVNGEIVRLPKRILLLKLEEIHKLFLEKYENFQLSITTFAKLRPKNCIFAGSKETHQVCLCIYCTNLKYCLKGGGFLQKFNKKSYHEVVQIITCPSPTEKCYNSECSQGIQSFLDRFRELLIENAEYEIAFLEWTTENRVTLMTRSEEIEDFLENLKHCLEIFLPHYFTKIHQQEFLTRTKNNLKKGEVLVLLDFSENYTFTIQDSIQSYYFHTPQCTIVTFEIYYKDDDDQLKNCSFAVIAESNDHNAATVHLHIEKMIRFLKTRISYVQKIIYMSDGAGGQYKNKKNFLNICYHKKDFDISCEWNFFATSHGKSPCDGVGAAIKKIARLASLRNNKILNAQDLFNYCKNQNWHISFALATIEEQQDREVELESRYILAKTIDGTRKFHAIYPISLSEIVVKTYSLSTEIKTKKMLKKTKK